MKISEKTYMMMHLVYKLPEVGILEYSLEIYIEKVFDYNSEMVSLLTRAPLFKTNDVVS